MINESRVFGQHSAQVPPMMFAGQAAIDYLAIETGKADPGESSHWRKYHADFRFLGNRFEGLQGFGGTKSHNFLRAGIHRVMQRRFHLMGREFPEFGWIDALARDITCRQGRLYDLDVLRQTLTVALLRGRIPERLTPETTACVIGDGFATMTSLLLASASSHRIVLVNLTRTLLVDLWYLKLWMGQDVFDASVVLVNDSPALARVLDATVHQGARVQQVIAVQAVHHELVRDCPIDLALNVASMQEMDPPVIAGYFDDLRAIAAARRLDFYCCNREEKKLPDGTVVRFRDYPWRSDDKLILDELCPWHQEYYAATPPFFRAYDGPIRHRLASLAA